MNLRAFICRPTPLVILTATWIGCVDSKQLNQSVWIDEDPPARDESANAYAAKAGFWYPLRDIATLDPIIRHLFPDRARNLDESGEVPDSSFYTNRSLAAVAGGATPIDPWADTRPQAPWTLVKRKAGGATPGFVGRDESGRKYQIKLDRLEFPELGTAAEVIGARIMYLLGYHVPPVYVTTISGTGDPQFDGRRASASLYIDANVHGHFPFDWLRYRREFRAARLACAWINEVDRAANNGLVATRDGRSYFYLLDFNSALGSWNGVPKEPWQGWRYRSDPGWSWMRTIFPELNRDGFDPHQPIRAPAIGRFDAAFDPDAWRPNLPNTAFDHMTAEDAEWMARKIRALPDSVLRQVVESARYSDSEDSEYVYEVLIERRKRILDVYLGND